MGKSGECAEVSEYRVVKGSPEMVAFLFGKIPAYPMNRNLFNQSAIVVIDNVQRMNDNKIMKPFKSADGKTYYDYDDCLKSDY